MDEKNVTVTGQVDEAKNLARMMKSLAAMGGQLDRFSQTEEMVAKSEERKRQIMTELVGAESELKEARTRVEDMQSRAMHVLGEAQIKADAMAKELLAREDDIIGAARAEAEKIINAAREEAARIGRELSLVKLQLEAVRNEHGECARRLNEVRAAFQALREKLS